MIPESKKAIKVFYAYSHKDKSLKDKLDQHLQALKQSGKIMTWSDYEIQAGEARKAEISAQLATADIILLLVSPDFLSSDYYCSEEMKQIYIKHDTGEACIIPIILRPIFLEGLPLQNLLKLPSGGKPVTQWPQRDSAFEDIARGIHGVVEKLLLQEQERHLSPAHLKETSVVSTQLETKTCPSCHMVNRTDSRFCKQCGWPFKYKPERIKHS